MWHFVDDDAGYQRWLAGHPSGFVINTTRRPTARYLILHRADCRTISGSPARGVTFTRDYSKLCGDHDELEAFAASLGGEAQPCGLCLRRRGIGMAGGQVLQRFVAADEVPGAVGVSRLRGDVFISYVREDSAAVDWLQQMLEAAGVRVWRDTDSLWPGQDWAAAIRRAITDDALVFVACFSRASVARERTYQREELMLAVDQLRQRRPDRPWLIPVRFDGCQIPGVDIGAGRTLASIQCADLFGVGCADSCARLLAAIMQILSEHAGPAGGMPGTAGQDLSMTGAQAARAQLARREAPWQVRELAGPVSLSAGQNAGEVRQGAGGHLVRSAVSQDEWVGAVMAFADIDDPEFRRAVLRRMGDLLGLDHSFMASYRPVARDHVVDIVARCWDFRSRADALVALATSLSALRPDDRAAGRIRQMPGAS